MFALDVFSEGYGFKETIFALFMHLVPTYLVVAALVIAWRWEGVGAILFVALALFYMMMSRGAGWIISGPLLLIGFLFFSTGIFVGGQRSRGKHKSEDPYFSLSG